MLWIRYAGLEAGGHHGDVTITDFSGISNDLRLDRTDRLGRHGQMAGKDYISKRVWTMTLTTLVDDENGAVALASEWENAVLNDDVMLSTELAMFEYSRDRATWYRVYGRPSDYAGPDLGDYTREGAGEIVLQFEQLDPWHYSEHSEQVTIPVAREASGGLQAPVRVPVRVARSGGAVDRWGSNAGEKTAPVTLRFDGPLSDPEVTLQGHWTFRVDGSLAYDEYLVIDPSDLSNPRVTIYSTTGAAERSAFTMIRTGSRITDLVLPPGQHAFTFRAIDPTFTASMTATWPHTYASMQ